MKLREEARKNEAIALKKKQELANAEEERRKDALAAEMDGKNYTFDTNGKLMWIDNVDGNKLPKFMSEVTSQGESKEAKKKQKQEEEAAAAKAAEEVAQAKAAAAKGRGRTTPKAKAKPFTDGFTRLTTEQPPILDTMKVTSGVVLGHKGQMKKGTSTWSRNRQMYSHSRVE